MTKPFRSTIEALEPRIAPATVTHTLVNGVLKISPLLATGAATFALVQVDADTFNLLDGAAPIPLDGVKNIQIKLTDLVDNIDLVFNGTGFRGDVSVASGQGADLIDFLGTGANVIDATVISTGASLVTIGNLGILGDVKVTSAGGAFVNYGGIGTLSLTGVGSFINNGTIISNAKIVALDSPLTVRGPGAYNGDLLIKGSPVSDEVTISGRVDGKLTFNAGDGANQFIGDQSFFVGGRLTVNGGTGNDIVSISMAGLDPFTTGLGSAVFSLGEGNNSVGISGNARIAGSVRVSTLNGNDGVNFSSSSGILSIGGALQLALGNGQNGIAINGAILNSGINYVGGTGADTVNIQGTDLVGAAKFTLGNSTNQISITGSNLDSTLYVKGGVDNDTVFLGGAVVLGKATIFGGDGQNLSTFTFSQLRAGFAYQGGLGMDQVILDANSQFFGVGSMKGGAGLNILDARTLGGFSSFTYTGGVDQDVLLLAAPGGVIVNFKASLGDGSDSATVNTTAFRSLKIDFGSGDTDSLTRIAALTGSSAVFTGFDVETVL